MKMILSRVMQTWIRIMRMRNLGVAFIVVILERNEEILLKVHHARLATLFKYHNNDSVCHHPFGSRWLVS
jgi:isopentenyldiphosphate isomerase